MTASQNLDELLVPFVLSEDFFVRGELDKRAWRLVPSLALLFFQQLAARKIRAARLAIAIARDAEAAL